MSPFEQRFTQTRRDFLATSSCGLGTLALASLLKQDGMLAIPTAPGLGLELDPDVVKKYARGEPLL